MFKISEIKRNGYQIFLETVTQFWISENTISVVYQLYPTVVCNF